MAFDIYFQHFENGDAGTEGADEALRVLGPYLRPSADAPERIEHPGGTADIYGVDDTGMMINHLEGDALWDLLVETAIAAQWTIMPVGSPVCVFSDAMLEALPEGLDEDAIMISSGEQLRRAILSS